jgi:hypothetical protein
MLFRLLSLENLNLLYKLQRYGSSHNGVLGTVRLRFANFGIAYFLQKTHHVAIGYLKSIEDILRSVTTTRPQ